MATEKVILVTIPKGSSETSIEPIKGFKDGSCLKETEGLQNALGTVKKQVKKPEALRTPEKEKVNLGKK